MSDFKDYPSDMQQASTGRRSITKGSPPRKMMHPYPRAPHLSGTRGTQSVYPDSCSTNKDLQAYCLDPEGRLQDSLLRGSARSLAISNISQPLLPSITLSVPTGPQAFDIMGSPSNPRPATGQRSWQANLRASTQEFSSAPQMMNYDPSSFTIENPDAAGRSRSSKPQGSRPTTRRPTPDEFREMVMIPHSHVDRLQEYVGTDSKYSMAANHTMIMVRAVQSQDMPSRMREVSRTLEAIDNFLEFLLAYTPMKQEQKGCVALRISFAALTALMGDFSQGEVPASDPHAPVVPRMYLPTFRQHAPLLGQVVFHLSQKLEKSINMYKHRRSPSNSLVTKFEGMLQTLTVWNDSLGDDTFREPTKVIAHWLTSHQQQVENKHRIQGRSPQPSPILSDTNPSPSHRDASGFLSPQSAYAVPTSSRSSQSSIHLTSGHPQFATGNMPSLFSPRDVLPAPEHGVTYYSSTIDPHRYLDSTSFSQTPGDYLSGMYEPAFPTPSSSQNYSGYR